ncbi:MAG: DUF2079 domain-containing protein [Caldilineaceae bacterium]
MTIGPAHASAFSLRQRLPVMLLWLAIVAYALYFGHLTLTRYAAYEARALDMGNLHQTVWNTAHGRPFQMTNQPGVVNRLSLHVEPILLPIAAFYWLHDGPETLLILQAVVVALGAAPLFALARLQLQNSWLALIFALVYLLNPTIQAANYLEFHPLTLVPTFLIAAFYFLLTRQVGWFALFACLAASCKEEIALLLLMMGLYAIVRQHRYRLGSVTMVLALTWPLLAVLFIQNYFAAGNIHWGRYSYLGATPVQMVTTLLTQPGLVVQQLQAAEALRYLRELLLPVGFTALLAPEVLLLALPSLALNLLADFPPMHQVYTLIYAAPIAPFVLMAAVMGISRLRTALHQHTKWPHDLATGGLVGLSLASALLVQWQAGYLPWGGNYHAYAVTAHHQAAAALIAQIPPAAKVSAQDRLDPHVAGRETVYIYPRVDDADTILVDVTGPAWPQHPHDLYTSLQGWLANGFGVAAASDGYLLLSKNTANQTIPDAFYTAFRRPAWSQEQEPLLTFGDQLQLLDYAVTTDVHGEVVVQLVWRATQPLPADLRFYIGYWDAAGNVLHDSQFYQPVATLWYPTSMWRTQEPVLVQSLPWALEAERFTLVLGLYRGEDGWDKGGRLPLRTPATAGLIPLEQGTVARLGGYEHTSAGWRPFTPTAMPEAARAVAIGAGMLTLEGVSLQQIPHRAGEPLTFTLHWRAGSTPPDFDYALFAHVLDETGNKVAQLDWQPRDALGVRPMTTWLPDEALADTESVLLPADAPSSSYHVIVGVYNWATGARLPVSGEGSGEGGDDDNVTTVAQFRLN